MKLAVLFLIATAAVCVCGDDQNPAIQGSSLAQQFFDYAKSLDNVMAAWEKFIKTSPSEEAERKQALDEFLAVHNQTNALKFDTFSSVLVGDVSNPHLSLQQALLEAHRHNLAAAKAAIEDAIMTYRRASVMEINILVITKSEDEAVENLKGKIESIVKVAEVNAKLVIENYKEKGWKKYLDSDIQNIIKEKGASQRLLKELIDFLQTVYPFRTWLVANYRSNEPLPSRFCVESRPFIHRYYYNDEKTELLVAHADEKPRFGSSSEAELRLSRLTQSDWHWRWCHKKAGDIYAELNYSCGSQRHVAVMVLPLAPNQFSFLASNDGRVHAQTVSRHFPLFCHQDYRVLIFT